MKKNEQPVEQTKTETRMKVRSRVRAGFNPQPDPPG